MHTKSGTLHAPKWPYTTRQLAAFRALALACSTIILAPHAYAIQLPQPRLPARQSTSASELATQLKVGDLVFIRVAARPFREVASATGTWTNHVGIVTNIDGAEPLIGESTFPFSRITTFSKFVNRSEHGQVAVKRLKFDLTPQQIQLVQAGVRNRSGIFYDTGFNLESHKEFCSRFAYEVLKEATGVSVGKVETFKEMLASRPGIDLGFWQIWYFGRIPWDRQTISPASLLNSPELVSIFNGNILLINKPIRG